MKNIGLFSEIFASRLGRGPGLRFQLKKEYAKFLVI